MWIYFIIAIHLSVGISCPERNLAARNVRFLAVHQGRHRELPQWQVLPFVLRISLYNFPFLFKDLHFKNGKVELKNYKRSMVFIKPCWVAFILHREVLPMPCPLAPLKELPGNQVCAWRRVGLVWWGQLALLSCFPIGWSSWQALNLLSLKDISILCKWNKM